MKDDTKLAGKTVTKKDLVDRIADQTNAKRITVKKVIQSFLDEIVNELGHGNRLEFRDFGVFEIRERAPRLAQNPKTMEKVEVPRKRTVKFKVGRLMKQMLTAPVPTPRTATIVAAAGPERTALHLDGTPAHDGAPSLAARGEMRS